MATLLDAHVMDILRTAGIPQWDTEYDYAAYAQSRRDSDDDYDDDSEDEPARPISPTVPIARAAAAAPARTPETLAMVVTRGKGAQETARRAGAMYLYQIDPRGPANAYYGFATREARNAAAALHCANGVEVVERCDGTRPAKPYIDVDAPGDAPDFAIDNAIAAFSDVAREWGAPADRLAPIVNRVDRAGKRSLHLIADGWAVDDGAAAAEFAQAVKGHLAAQGAHASEWVDRAGGRKSYGLRIAGCPKAGDASAMLTGPVTWIQDDAQVCAWAPPVPVDESADTSASDEDAPQAAPLSAAAMLKAFISTILVTFAGIYELDPDGGGVAPVAFNRVKAAHCSACDKEHDRAGAYISQAKDGSLFLRCRRSPAGGPALDKMYAKKTKNMAMPSADDYDDMTPGTFETVGGPGVYNADAIGNDGVSDLYVASSWGTGKSQHNAAIVRELLAKNPRAVIIIVSSRKSLSAQLTADIHAISYDRIKGNLDPKRNPVTVWQVDSMGRIPPGVKPDLLIVDEINQLTAHAYQSGEGKGKAAAGISTLRALFQRAGRVIVSDNDLTAQQVDAVRKLRPGKPYHAYRNAFQPWAQTSVRIVNEAKGVQSVDAELFEFLDKQHAERQAGRPWEACAVPCHSLTVARLIAIDATGRYGAKSVRLYTSETGDDVKRRDFADATAAWDPADGSGPLIVIYTGTVSVGVSCSSERFTTCFSFFKDGNAAATQSAQMLFRCRKLRTVVVSYQGRIRCDLPQIPRELFRWVVDARNLSALPDSFRHDRNPFITAPTASDARALSAQLRNNFEGSLWVSHMMEANRSARWFVPRMAAIIKRAGMTVTIENATAPTPEPAEPVAAPFAHEIGPDRMTLMAENLERRYDKAVTALADNQDPDAVGVDKSEADKAGDRARFICRDMGQDDPRKLITAFAEAHRTETAEIRSEKPDEPHADETPEELTAEYKRRLADWLNDYEYIAPLYVRACDVASPLPGRDIRELAVRSDLEANEIIRELFRLAGASVMARELSIPVAKMLDPDTLEYCERVNKHASRLFDNGDGRSRARVILGAKTDGRKRQSIQSTLNTVLNSVGGELVPEYKTVRDETRCRPSSYSIVWKWDGTAAPRPLHPTEAAAKRSRQLGGGAPVRGSTERASSSGADIADLLQELAHLYGASAGFEKKSNVDK